MTPRQILLDALAETFRDALGRVGRVKLAPALTAEEIDGFDRQQSARDLLGFAGASLSWESGWTSSADVGRSPDAVLRAVAEHLEEAAVWQPLRKRRKHDGNDTPN
jgi:hypothetical protein